MTPITGARELAAALAALLRELDAAEERMREAAFQKWRDPDETVFAESVNRWIEECGE